MAEKNLENTIIDSGHKIIKKAIIGGVVGGAVSFGLGYLISDGASGLINNFVYQLPPVTEYVINCASALSIGTVGGLMASMLSGFSEFSKHEIK